MCTEESNKWFTSWKRYFNGLRKTWKLVSIIIVFTKVTGIFPCVSWNTYGAKLSES